MRMNDQNKNRGFTLIELMMVVAIVAIIATFAVPAYQDAVRKGKRADAVAALSKLQLAQEKLRGSCANYANALGTADNCAGRTINWAADGFSAQDYYAISITAATGNSYTLQADPRASQAGDTACDPMTITYANGTTTKGPAGCWGK